MFKDFEDYGWDAEKYCHKIYSGKEKQRISCYHYYMAINIQLKKPFFKDFEVAIGDEAHLFKSKSLVSIYDKDE